MRKIALIGNPNCGKTTLFNLLTGANQKVGNWPGVTVEKKFGYFKLDDKKVELVDLPGIYSLEQEHQGIDEKIAVDYLEQADISLIINIVDAAKKNNRKINNSSDTYIEIVEIDLDQIIISQVHSLRMPLWNQNIIALSGKYFLIS